MENNKMPLEYARGVPPRRHPPPLMFEHGCRASILGAVVCGIIAPCIGFYYVVYVLNDTGGFLIWPFVILMGGIAGAIAGPITYATFHSLLWRIGFRPWKQ
jgi:hypothetical protein